MLNRSARTTSRLIANLSLLLILVLTHGGVGAVAADAGRAAKPQRILVLGDSISAAYGIQREQGWVALLQERLREEAAGYTVVNASISGETTGGGLARLDQALEAHNPSIVVVELGGNDGLRGYPTQRIEQNLSSIVASVRSAGAQPLLVAMQIPPNYGIRYTRAFRKVFKAVAEDNDITLVPQFIEGAALSGQLQSDGIHPTAEAQPALLDAIWPYLEALF